MLPSLKIGMQARSRQKHRVSAIPSQNNDKFTETVFSIKFCRQNHRRKANVASPRPSQPSFCLRVKKPSFAAKQLFPSKPRSLPAPTKQTRGTAQPPKANPTGLTAPKAISATPSQMLCDPRQTQGTQPPQPQAHHPHRRPGRNTPRCTNPRTLPISSPRR